MKDLNRDRTAHFAQENVRKKMSYICGSSVRFLRLAYLQQFVLQPKTRQVNAQTQTR